MKYLFAYVFLCFIFGSVLTENIPRYKLARLGLALRKLKLHKEEMRKLQEATDEDDEYKTDQAIPPTTAPYSNSTGDQGQETGDANAADAPIAADTPVSTQGTETEKKDAGIQVMKFHNFKPVQRTITFGVFFFFINKPIPRFIIFRIRITYRLRLRGLEGETESADTVRTLCSLKATQLAGKIKEDGKTVDYDCSATASQDITADTNITLNTDVNMVTVDSNGTATSVDFSDVNFNANTTAEAASLQQNKIEVDDSKVSINYLRNGGIAQAEKNLLRIVGVNKNDIGNEIVDGESVRMILKTSNRRGEKRPEQYDCIVYRTGDNLTMDCDISHKSINTSNQDLHLSISNDTSQILTVQMADYNNTTPIVMSSSNYVTYRKNSGGLSGGAIAGIVIACVVVLAAASIAAIMLKRPKQPTDNTTVVGLKTVDNI